MIERIKTVEISENFTCSVSTAHTRSVAERNVDYKRRCSSDNDRNYVVIES